MHGQPIESSNSADGTGLGQPHRTNNVNRTSVLSVLLNMSDTIETLSYDFPLFSKDLISEVVRLKGDRAREALTRLACDDVDSHRPSQMSSQGYDVLSCDTSAPSASENYPLSATNSSMSISTTTSADEAEVLREIDGPAPKHMIATKAESTQSGRPDVVLGEEELETVSCPGFYEEERRGFDITEKGISRDRPYSPCLEELFQLPLDVRHVMLSLAHKTH